MRRALGLMRRALERKVLMHRGMVLVHLVVIGFVVQAVSYFLLATPWGMPPASVAHSDPRVPFATLFFILGVVLVFLGVLLYEILPEGEIDKGAVEQGED